MLNLKSGSRRYLNRFSNEMTSSQSSITVSLSKHFDNEQICFSLATKFNEYISDLKNNDPKGLNFVNYLIQQFRNNPNFTEMHYQKWQKSRNHTTSFNISKKFIIELKNMLANLNNLSSDKQNNDTLWLNFELSKATHVAPLNIRMQADKIIGFTLYDPNRGVYVYDKQDTEKELERTILDYQEYYSEICKEKVQLYVDTTTQNMGTNKMLSQSSKIIAEKETKTNAKAQQTNQAVILAITCNQIERDQDGNTSEAVKLLQENSSFLDNDQSNSGPLKKHKVGLEKTIGMFGNNPNFQCTLQATDITDENKIEKLADLDKEFESIIHNQAKERKQNELTFMLNIDMEARDTLKEPSNVNRKVLIKITKDNKKNIKQREMIFFNPETNIFEFKRVPNIITAVSIYKDSLMADDNLKTKALELRRIRIIDNKTLQELKIESAEKALIQQRILNQIGYNLPKDMETELERQLENKNIPELKQSLAQVEYYKQLSKQTKNQEAGYKVVL